MSSDFLLDSTTVPNFNNFSFNTLNGSHTNFRVNLWSKSDNTFVINIINAWWSIANGWKYLTVWIEEWFNWVLILQSSLNVKYVKFICDVVVIAINQYGSFTSESCVFWKLTVPYLTGISFYNTQIEEFLVQWANINSITISKKSVIKRFLINGSSILTCSSFIINELSHIEWQLPLISIQNGSLHLSNATINETLGITGNGISSIKIGWESSVIWGISIVDGEFSDNGNISIQNITVTEGIFIKNDSGVDKIKIYNVFFSGADSFLHLKKLALLDKNVFFLIDIEVPNFLISDSVILNNQTKFNNIKITKKLIIEDNQLIIRVTS